MFGFMSFSLPAVSVDYVSAYPIQAFRAPRLIGQLVIQMLLLDNHYAFLIINVLLRGPSNLVPAPILIKGGRVTAEARAKENGFSGRREWIICIIISPQTPKR
jgi:hypothetical protein